LKQFSVFKSPLNISKAVSHEHVKGGLPGVPTLKETSQN